MEHLTAMQLAFDKHVQQCTACWLAWIRKIADAPDANLCPTGRELLPRIGGAAVAIPIEDDVNFETRTRTRAQVAR